MQPNWAEENLQVIRTLMERAGLYRRALAPVMLAVGGLGVVGGVVGQAIEIKTYGWSVLFWAVVCFLASLSALLISRKQALRCGEVFWSSPTRRVATALLPCLLAAAGLTLVVALRAPGQSSGLEALPPIWMAFYGCALHAAGFFVARGMRLLGWAFIAGAVMNCNVLTAAGSLAALSPHYTMGIAFGGLHLLAAAYLYFTEKPEVKP